MQGPPGPPGEFPPSALVRITEFTERSENNSNRLEKLRIDLGGLRDRSREGTAMALALGGLRIPYNKDRSFSMRFGQFMGETAIAAQGAFRVSEDPDVTVDVGAAYGVHYSQSGFTAGFTWSW